MRYTQLVIVLLGLLFSCNTKEKEEEESAYLTAVNTLMAAPLLECENLFFTDSVKVAMKFSLPDSNIKYTLDGSDVRAESKTYEKPLLLDKTTLLKAKNFHPEFQSSNDASIKVIKTNSKLAGSKIDVNPNPNERYKATGTSSLTDHIKGTSSFANGNAWLGFQSDSIRMEIKLSQAQTLSKVIVSTMVNHGAWIFVPKKITVFSGTREIGKVDLPKPSKEDTFRLEFIDIPIKKDIYDSLSIMVSSVNEIPEWHQGKGTVAWFFTDEILVE